MTVNEVGRVAHGDRDAGVGRHARWPSEMPGTTSNGTPAASSAGGLLAAPGEHEGVAALEPDHLPARPGPARPAAASISSWAMVALAGRLAHVDALGAGRGQVEQAGHREPVVHDDVGPAQHLGPPHGQQPGIARARLPPDRRSPFPH